MRVRFIFLVMAFMGIFVAGGGYVSPQGQAPMMSKDELKLKLGSPGLVVIDLRNAIEADGRAKMIKGAIRENPAIPEKWSDKYRRENTLVLYCSCKEDKLSFHVAKKLTGMGFHKVYVLKGGWNEWVKACYPTMMK